MSEVRKTIDTDRIRKAVQEILLAVGEDLEREGVKKTPERVARMYGELLGGTFDDPNVHIESVFTEPCDEIVLLRDIPFYSICEHHMLPFVGKAHVAYLPSGKVLGVSKLARIVDCFAHRLQCQERLTGQIADALMRKLNPRGAIVVVEAEHLCMAMRGVRKPGAVTTTSAVRGQFKTCASLRAEALDLILRK